MESSSRTEWALLAAAGEGDGEAFRTLVETHQERIARLCGRLLGDREAALDATQEVFLKAYRKAPTLEPRGQLYTWLYRVAVNHCLNRLRRRKIVTFLRLERPVGDELSTFEPPDSAADPEQALASKRCWYATREAIERLPVSQRSVLLLARLEGLSYRRIAEVLNISIGAVESRLFRAMRTLERAQEAELRGVSLSRRS